MCQRVLCPLVGMVERGDRLRPTATLRQPEQGACVEFLIIGEQSRLPVVTESTARLTAYLEPKAAAGQLRQLCRVSPHHRS